MYSKEMDHRQYEAAYLEIVEAVRLGGDDLGLAAEVTAAVLLHGDVPADHVELAALRFWGSVESCFPRWCAPAAALRVLLYQSMPAGVWAALAVAQGDPSWAAEGHCRHDNGQGGCWQGCSPGWGATCPVAG